MSIKNIIGSSLFLALFLFFITHTASVEISVRDMQGAYVTQVGSKQPFALHLDMHDIDGSNARVSIEKNSAITLQRTSVQMRSINGDASTTYIYRAQVQESGAYTIGPLYIDVDGMRYQTNVVNIEVTDQAIPIHGNNGTTIMFRVIPSDEHAYVGQLVPCVLRFYYNNTNIKPERIVQPDVGDLIRSSLDGPYAGREEVDGELCDFIEWRCTFFAQNPGSYTVPAYIMEYIDHSKRNKMRNPFSFLFDTPVAYKQSYSNSFSLIVDPLPVCDGASEAVGSFVSCSAKLDKSVFTVGDAATFTLDVIGKGNGAHMHPPLLKELPRSIKYYDSHTHTTPCNDSECTSFEYVIQALHAGEYEIPSQSFMYFDPEKKEYYTLHSNPLYFVINPGKQNAVVDIDTDNQITIEKKENENVLRPLHVDGPWYAERKPFFVPWILFFMLWLLPLLFLVGLYGYYLIKRYRQKTCDARRYKHAFLYAKKAFRNYKKLDNAHMLVSLFIQLFADRLSMNINDITQDIVQKKLKQVGIPPEMLRALDIFWVRLMELAFAHTSKKKLTVNSIYDDAESWLQKLEKLL